MTDANFLSSVAHELRNPIAVIRALAQTLSLSRDRLSEDEVNECLSRLLRQADRLGHDLVVNTCSGRNASVSPASLRARPRYLVRASCSPEVLASIPSCNGPEISPKMF